MSQRLLPVASGREVRRHLRHLVRGRRLGLALALATMVADSALSLAGPVAIGWVTQAIATGRGAHAIIGPVALLLGAALLAALTTWASQVLLARVVVPAVARLREETVAVASELPLSTIEAGGTGDLVSRVSGDVELVTDAATEALASFLTAAFTIAAALIGLAALDWRLALAGLLAVPIQGWTLRWYLRASGPIYAAARAADGRRASTLLTGFTSLPTLRSLLLERRQRDLIEKASLESIRLDIAATRAATRFYGRLNAAEFLGLSAILLAAFALVRDGDITIGAATTAALFFVGLFDPINTVLGVFDSIQEAAAGLGRLVGIVTLRTAAPATARIGELSAHPTLKTTGLGFSYRPGDPVLADVSLSLTPGRHLAVVGASGSGKSTLATILSGVRTADAGILTLDGVPVDALDLPQRLAPLVTQETHVFSGTVADNVLLGRPDSTPEEVAAALDTVGATAWIAALPDGLATVVGSGGHPLSAAQAQELALARVHLMDPPVVVLDEASAEAGSAAAGDLDRAAAHLAAGRSSVVVAHRLSQVAGADEILVMERGRIVERGTHHDLLALGGTYARLWQAWSATS